MQCPRKNVGMPSCKHLAYALSTSAKTVSTYRLMRAYLTSNRAALNTERASRSGITPPTSGASVWQRIAMRVTPMTQIWLTVAMHRNLVAHAVTSSRLMAKLRPAVTSADAKLHRACIRAKCTIWRATNASRFVASLDILIKPVLKSGMQPARSAYVHVTPDTHRGKANPPTGPTRFCGDYGGIIKRMYVQNCN